MRVYECMYACMHTVCMIPPRVGMLSQALIHEFVGKQSGNVCAFNLRSHFPIIMVKK